MKIVIYTRPPEHGSSITTRHWQSALARSDMETLRHDLVVCHAEEDLRQHLLSADIVVSSKADLRKFVSPDHTSIKFIFFAFAGVDHLAPFDWVPSGAYVVNNSGATSQAIGDYTIFALQLMANNIVGKGEGTFLAAARENGFASLTGRGVTIIGVGGVGGGIAAICKTFRMKVYGVRRSGRSAPNVDRMYTPSQLAKAISQSDFVVIACPVTPETRGLFSASVIASMKPGAYLVNVARGSIVDVEAVCDAVDSGALGGAVLDVIGTVPPKIEARVRSTQNILVTPHVSGDDKYHFIDNSLDVFWANLRQFLNGEEPSNAVDFALGY